MSSTLKNKPKLVIAEIFYRKFIVIHIVLCYNFISKGGSSMKKLRLILSLILSTASLLALFSCAPVDNEPIDSSKTYTVEFDTAGADAIATQTVSRNAKIVKPEDPVREGYEFLGWYSGNMLWDFDEYKVRKDIALVAKWQIKSYTVTFVGGYEDYDGSDVQYSTVSVPFGGKVNKAPSDPQRENYVFKGWTADGEEWDINTPICKDTEVLASWNRLYWISFNTNGGERIEPYQVEAGTVIEKPGIPYMSDHYFVGWYSLVDEFTLGEHDFSKPVTKNIKLEAKWITRSGYIYHDQTLMKIILPDEYRFADGQYITNLKNALDKHLIYDSEVVSADSHELAVKYTEIVVGRSDRQISIDAYARLEKIEKATDSTLRYLVYVGSVQVAEDVFTTSVCIAYDEDEEGLAMRLAISAFIDNYLGEETLTMRSGRHLVTTFEPSDYAEPTAFSGEMAIVSYGKEEI